MNRLVRFGPFLNEELWIGADDMRAHRCGSQVRRGEGGMGVAVAEESARCEGGGDPLDHGGASEPSNVSVQ